MSEYSANINKSPLGIPHNSEKEDKYQDFTIPTDCSVLANIWYVFQSPPK